MDVAVHADGEHDALPVQPPQLDRAVREAARPRAHAPRRWCRPDRSTGYSREGDQRLEDRVRRRLDAARAGPRGAACSACRTSCGRSAQAVDEWKPAHRLQPARGVPRHQRSSTSTSSATSSCCRCRYTGCNPRGLMMARDKALSKKIARLPPHPRAEASPSSRRGRQVRRPAGSRFPLIVKSLTEEASLGIAQASVVRLRRRSWPSASRFIHEQLGSDAIAEEFIDGPRALRRRARQPARHGAAGVGAAVREHAAGQRRDRHRAREAQPATTRRSAASSSSRPTTCRTTLVERLHRGTTRPHLPRCSTSTATRASTTGWRDGGELYFLEANPNPEIAPRRGVRLGGGHGGHPYERLLQRILRLGLRRGL